MEKIFFLAPTLVGDTYSPQLPLFHKQNTAAGEAVARRAAAAADPLHWTVLVAGDFPLNIHWWPFIAPLISSMPGATSHGKEQPLLPRKNRSGVRSRA
jgi:hypothetical protein